MKICPKCQSFSVEFDPYIGNEKCLWNDCLWVNRENLNLDKVKFEVNFGNFRRSIKIKNGMAP